MILEIDLGNTRIKWRENAGKGRASPTIAMPIQSQDELPALAVSCLPERVRISTVRGTATEHRLVSWCRHHFGLTPEFARSSTHVAGVTNGYAEPARLGVDRWLAMLAGFRMVGSAFVIFDFGSAMTADVVNDQGVHLGGFIGPGLHMMEGSLLSNTDLVRFSAGDPGSVVPGTQTREAVANGVMAAAVGFANEIWAAVHESAGVRMALLTGGDGPLVAPHLRFPAQLTPDLVLDGLALALP